jgi:hypothetical protein
MFHNRMQMEPASATVLQRLCLEWWRTLMRVACPFNPHNRAIVSFLKHDDLISASILRYICSATVASDMAILLYEVQIEARDQAESLLITPHVRAHPMIVLVRRQYLASISNLGRMLLHDPSRNHAVFAPCISFPCVGRAGPGHYTMQQAIASTKNIPVALFSKRRHAIFDDI